MGRRKGSKNKIEQEENDITETNEVDDRPVVNLSELAKKRNKLIDELKGLLLTKHQLKTGGRAVRSKALKESNYQANIDEINALGKELGEAPVGFGDLRR